MSGWFKQQFSAILLAALFCVTLLYTLHVMHAADVDNTTLAWSREQAALFAGGLLMVLTGEKKKDSDKPGLGPNGSAQ